jgi:hypothetical protein
LTPALATLPLWVRGGEILPLGPAQDFVDQKPLDPLTLELYAPQGSRELVIEDEDRPSIPVAYKRRGKKLTVKVGATPGLVEVILYGVQAVSASCGNAPLPLSADGAKVQWDGRGGFEIVFTLK